MRVYLESSPALLVPVPRTAQERPALVWSFLHGGSLDLGSAAVAHDLSCWCASSPTTTSSSPGPSCSSTSPAPRGAGSCSCPSSPSSPATPCALALTELVLPLEVPGEGDARCSGGAGVPALAIALWLGTAVELPSLGTSISARSWEAKGL